MKKKKNSMLTIGAFAIVGILIVGTIIGVIMTQTSKSNNTSSEKGGLIPLVTTEPAASESGVTDELQTDKKTGEQTDKNDTQQEDDDDDKKANNDTKTGDDKSSDKSSKATRKPTKTAKPKDNKSDNDNTDKGNNTDQGLTDQKPSGKDNEISFSDFE